MSRSSATANMSSKGLESNLALLLQLNKRLWRECTIISRRLFY